MTQLTTHTDPWKYKTNDTNCHKWRKIYIFLVQECSLLQVYLSLSMNLQTSLASQLRSKTGEGDCLQWGWQGKNDSVPDSFNTMLTLDALRRDWRVERKLHNYIEEPSQWQGYNMYMAPLTLSLHLKVRGRERILHLCSGTKQNPLPPMLAHIVTLLSLAWHMSKQDRQKSQCWSLYRREYIQLPASCPSRVGVIYKEEERDSHWNVSLYSRPRERQQVAQQTHSPTASSYHYRVRQHPAASSSLEVMTQFLEVGCYRLKCTAIGILEPSLLRCRLPPFVLLHLPMYDTQLAGQPHFPSNSTYNTRKSIPHMSSRARPDLNVSH